MTDNQYMENKPQILHDKKDICPQCGYCFCCGRGTSINIPRHLFEGKEEIIRPTNNIKKKI